MGNHDHYGSAEAQILYSQKHADDGGGKSAWILPNYFWTTEQAVGVRKLQLVFIDTVLMDEGITRAALLDKIREGVVEGEALAEWEAGRGTRSQAGEEQLAWLEGVLSSSRADWLIVCGHYPVFSGGEHGSTPSLMAKVPSPHLFSS